MRILIIASEAPPTNSGVSRCVARLADGLRERGHLVDILSSVQVPRLALGEVRLSTFAGHWKKLSSAVRDYDLVNVHGPAPTISDVLLLGLSRLPRDQRPPVVYTHHCAIDLPGLGVACSMYNSTHRMLARRVDHVVASSWDYANYHFMPGGAQIHTVPWGTDPRGLPPRRERTSGPLRVLFVGQMRSYKGVPTLLDAVAGQPNLELTLVGGGPLLHRYATRLARSGVGNVHFLGRQDEAELDRHYADHDVIVLPSLTQAEAFGLVLAEGMSVGCVPVASDLPGVREVAGATGLVVRPGDAAALRGALRSLATDRGRLLEMSRRSVRYAKELSWGRCVDRYEEIFLQAVGGPAAAREPSRQLAPSAGYDHQMIDLDADRDRTLDGAAL